MCHGLRLIMTALLPWVFYRDGVIVGVLGSSELAKGRSDVVLWIKLAVATPGRYRLILPSSSGKPVV
jgi:hypothetical protein